MSGQVHSDSERGSAVVGSKDFFKLLRPAAGQGGNQPARVGLTLSKVCKLQVLQQLRLPAPVITQHRVTQASRPALVQLAGCTDGFIDRGVIRNTHEFELVETEYEQTA